MISEFLTLDLAGGLLGLMEAWPFNPPEQQAVTPETGPIWQFALWVLRVLGAALMALALWIGKDAARRLREVQKNQVRTEREIAEIRLETATELARLQTRVEHLERDYAA